MKSKYQIFSVDSSGRLKHILEKQIAVGHARVIRDINGGKRFVNRYEQKKLKGLSET